jgi:hypothetical protein
MLLAVACANLAGLTLARSLTRRHKVAIRLALVLHSRLEAALDGQSGRSSD